MEYPIVTVGGLIREKDGKVLIVKSYKWKNMYALPGGKIELSETMEEAFYREMLEETSIKVVNIKFIYVHQSIFSNEFWKKSHMILLNFFSDMADGYSMDDVKLNDEANEYIWIDPKEALKLPLNIATRKLITRYIDQYAENRIS